LKTEFLILVPEGETFCYSKKSFVDFLKVDSLITISGQNILYRRSENGKGIVTAKFRVETDKVKSKQERYFLLAVECADQSLIDEFSELCVRIKTIAERISPGLTAVNTIWDDVGRIYAEQSYPLINDVENQMRRLIAKFMLITVGMNWCKDAIHPDLFKKIENYEDDEPNLNDLHKLDFIHLNQVLFEKKRDISLEEVDRLLRKTNFNDEDKERLLKYVPRSNWEKYFSTLIDEKDSSLEKKWELLYKLRNKVAHNRHVKKEEFETIKGLSSQIKDVITKATAKLGEIDLNEEDRELLIYSYNSDSPAAISFLSEKAVAEYYLKSGFEVESSDNRRPRAFDFMAIKESERIGVEVKSVRARHFIPMMRFTIERQLGRWLQSSTIEPSTKFDIVCVLRDDEIDYSINRIIAYALKVVEPYGGRLRIIFGRLNEENAFTLLDPLAGLDKDEIGNNRPSLSSVSESGTVSAEPLHGCLSNREYQILCWLGSGETTAEIADSLSLSSKTVAIHRANILKKMNFANNAELITYVKEKHLALSDKERG
jgi:DNA-binding CsgD family transcriptional regulator/DNA-binding transcriptional MerR regulator